MRTTLAALGQPLVVSVGEALPVLQEFTRQFRFTLRSHEETGNGLSYARDKAVRRWLRESGIERHELPTNGIVRRLADRDDWAGLWQERMRPAPLAAPERLQPVPQVELGAIPTHADLGLLPDVRAASLQRGGEAPA